MYWDANCCSITFFGSASVQHLAAVTPAVPVHQSLVPTTQCTDSLVQCHQQFNQTARRASGHGIAGAGGVSWWWSWWLCARLRGDEILIDYGSEWEQAWNEHHRSKRDATFHHEIGVPISFYPANWDKTDPEPYGDFIASPLAPGHMAPIRWKESAEESHHGPFAWGCPFMHP